MVCNSGVWANVQSISLCLTAVAARVHLRSLLLFIGRMYWEDVFMIRRALFFLALPLIAGMWIACGGNSSPAKTTSSAMASVTTVLSDPTTCGPPNGIFAHVFVTVTDVKIHQSATAGANDAGWVDLTPGITPQTIDLLGNPNNQCFLAQLSNGSVALQAGSYQQIRIMLAGSGSNSSCGNAGPNCVFLAADPNHPQPLQLSSQDQTGIKIPSGQIAGGQFTIAAGQSKDLDIHFDACDSIVIQGNGQYRLKPVLLGGEVSLQNNLISGQLVDKNGAALTGLTAMATLQQKDSTTGFDVVKQQIKVDLVTGKFSFCPLLISGTADLVVVAYDSKNNISYAASIVTGVSAGAGVNVQMLPVSAVSGTTITTAGLSSIKGEADSQNTVSTAGVVADVKLAALEDAGNSLFVTIPIVGSTTSTPTVTTAAPVAPAVCLTAKSFCAQFTLQVPGAPPNVGAAGSSISWSQASGAANYKVQGTATTCTPQTVTSDPTSVPSGTNVNLAKPLVFAGCQ
jgi:hypothetical protein